MRRLALAALAALCACSAPLEPEAAATSSDAARRDPASVAGDPATAFTLVRASLGPGGLEADGASGTPALSGDGRLVAFSSDATQLVAGDLNGQRDAFLRDLAAGTTELLSVASDGTPADGTSLMGALSRDGRRAVFMTLAHNLGGVDLGGWASGPWMIYLRDRRAGTTRPLSLTADGGAPSWDSAHPTISADGRRVAFASGAWDLVAGDRNFADDVFVVDLESGALWRASTGPGGEEANGPSAEPSLSADGRTLAFSSLASNLVPGDVNGTWDVFVKDLETGAVERVSVATGGAGASGLSRTPRLSADGRRVAFESFASDLVPGDDNGEVDVFVRDRISGTTLRASGGAGAASHAALSADGRRVAFQSTAPDLVPGDGNGASDVFLRDLATGLVTRVSLDAASAEVAGPSFSPSISDDGTVVAFTSDATQLVPGDLNGVRDVFVRAPAGDGCDGRRGGRHRGDHREGWDEGDHRPRDDRDRRRRGEGDRDDGPGRSSDRD